MNTTQCVSCSPISCKEPAAGSSVCRMSFIPDFRGLFKCPQTGPKVQGTCCRAVQTTFSLVFLFNFKLLIIAKISVLSNKLLCHKPKYVFWRDSDLTKWKYYIFKILLRLELGNIFLCITVQDFLDSMVNCIFRYRMDYYTFDDDIY